VSTHSYLTDAGPGRGRAVEAGRGREGEFIW